MKRDGPAAGFDGAAPDPAAFDPAVYVPALLSTLNNRLSSGASDLYLRRFGVGINAWRILTVLKQTPGCTAAFIAERAAIHLTVISRSLGEMQLLGLVEIDGRQRQRLIELTPQGRQLHDRIAAVALQREARLLAGLSGHEVVLLRGLLERLTANLAEVDSDARDARDAPPRQAVGRRPASS